jgi:hypothetical protein
MPYPRTEKLTASQWAAVKQGERDNRPRFSPASNALALFTAYMADATDAYNALLGLADAKCSLLSDENASAWFSATGNARNALHAFTRCNVPVPTACGLKVACFMADIDDLLTRTHSRLSYSPVYMVAKVASSEAA